MSFPPTSTTGDFAMRDFADVVAAPAGRFDGIERPYGVEDVLKLRGSIPIEHTLARRGAFKLWELLHRQEPVRALGALSGNQAMQMVRAGLEAIYLSGWQVAADSNVSGSMYPDQSLYPANSGPELARKINKTLARADQIEHLEGGAKRDWFAPIVADAEAGFGGPLNCFEIMKAYIEAGAAGVHFEDQLASEKKCGHLGGKVLVPTSQFIRTLAAARLAADVCGVPTILVARTDALSATLLTSDVDERDAPFVEGERVAEGMPAYVRVQEREFGLEGHGYTATRHQREVGAGYFDRVVEAVSGGESSTLALRGSTEEAQFTTEADKEEAAA